MLRRNVLLGISSIILGGHSNSVLAQEIPEVELVDPLPPLPEELLQYANDPPADFLQIVGVGTGRPSEKDIKTAFDILVNAPYNCTAVEVATYFRDVGQGAPDVSKFAREWPRIANPVIFHFFSATNTKPEGDVTAWCAAFMNWCIMRSRATSNDEIGKSPGTYSKSGKVFSPDNFSKYATKNAASGSFRCWKKVEEPKEGDILVLANKGTDGLTPHCLGQGHVAFFLSQTAENRVRVVGGNQTLPGSNGAVTRADFSIAPGTRFLKFVSSIKELE